MASKRSMKNDSLLTIARRQYSEGNLTQAEKLCRQYLRNSSTDIEAICLLGQILGDAGKPEDGARELQLALKLSPPNTPEPKIIMGKLSIQANRLESAKAWFIRALQDNSDLWEAHKYLGELAMSNYDTLQAINSLQAAHKLKPDDIEIESLLANAYSSHGKLADSILHYKNVLKQAPDHIAARSNLASVLRITGKYEDAREHYQIILKSQPEYPAAMAGMVEIYQATGEYDTAKTTIQDAVITRKIKHPELALVYARIMQNSGQPDDLESARNHLESLLTKDKLLVPGQRSLLNMTLGSIYESQKEYQKSFQCYQSGNSLHTRHFSEKIHIKLIDEIIQSFSPKQFSSLPKSRSTSKLPVFIIGMPRSGTSLTEQILSSHKNVYGAGELSFLHQSAMNLHKKLNTDHEYPQCINLLTQDLIDKIADEHNEHLKQLAIENKTNGNSNITRITDKMPQNFMHLGLIACLFPNAKIIHCQ